MHRVHAEAFGRPDEAAVVDRVRDAGAALVALVAECGGEVVGHVLFSPVTIPGIAAGPPPLGLAPLAVLPAHQGRGIGSLLTWAGLDRARAAGAPAVVVLGHPPYYPRFGVAPARRWGLSYAAFPPTDAFMAIELAPGALAGASGAVHYHEAFASL